MNQAAMPDAPNGPPQADSREVAASEAIAAIPARLSRWTAVWDWFNSPGQRRRWQIVILAAGTFYNIVVKLPWLVAIVVITVLLIQGLVQRTTAIEPISVPKALADGGYTPEVAAQRLRDALTQFVAAANSSMKSLDFALRGELPSIVVPTVGLSLETVMSSIRTFFDSARRHTISGEFIVKENLLWLRLRKDGRELYSSLKGVHLENPDELLAEAAPKILEAIQPYLVASWHYSSDPAKAFELANGIIARRPESDENVAWSYMLRGNIYSDRKEHAEAVDSLKKAVRLNSRPAVVHLNLGVALGRQGKNEDAIAAFREAIKLDAKYANGHIGLGIVLRAQGRNEEAIAALREAIRMDPKHPGAHNSLGNALGALGKNEEAIVAYREAIRMDPTYVRAHNGLGSVLRAQGNSEEAIAAYREAIRADPKHANAHYNLGAVLHTQPGKSDEAVAAYREAIKLNPDFSNAHYNLGLILKDQGKTDEAIAEFREAIRADPTDVAARRTLDDTLRDAPGARHSADEKPPTSQ